MNTTNTTTYSYSTQPVKATPFERLYHTMRQHDMHMHQSRKNLFLFSLVYGAIMVTLAISIF